MKQRIPSRPVVRNLSVWCAGAATLVVGVASPLPAFSAEVPQMSQTPRADTSGWVTTTVASDGNHPPAEFRVEPFTTGEGATLRISGTGWVSAAGDAGSTISIKINDLDENGKPRQFRRTDRAIGEYLSSLGQAEDPTTWALLLPEGARAADPDHGIFAVRPDGSFDITVKAPEELAHARSGHYLTVRAQSGRIMSGDVQRRGVSRPIPVDGVAAAELDHEAAGVCRTDIGKPTASIENRAVAPGGRLHLVGEGWCNPAESGGAPRVAVKIDEGKIARTDDTVFSNRTVWAIVDPDAETGSLDVWIDLPDGTDAASSPALSTGAHSLRLLSGSLRDGDLHTSFGGPTTLNFTVGEYRPNGLPDTVGLADLGPERARGVVVSRAERRVTVRVAGGTAGQWVIATPYVAGSARPQWGSGWMRLSEGGTFSYDLPSDMADGKYRLVVQRGDQGVVGEIAGWGWLDVQNLTPSSVTDGGTGTMRSAPEPSSSLGDHQESLAAASNAPDDAGSSPGASARRDEASPSGSGAAVAAGHPRAESALERFAGHSGAARKVLRLMPKVAGSHGAAGGASETPRPHFKEVPHTPDASIVAGSGVSSPQSEEATASRSGAGVATANNVLLALAGVVVLVATVTGTRRRQEATIQAREERE